MEEFIMLFPSIMFWGVIIFFTILFYLSLKKCFLEGKSKIKLIVFSLVTSPFLAYLEMVVLSTIAVWKIYPKAIENINNSTTFVQTDLFVLCFIIAVAYLLINYLYAWLMGKWLGVSTKSSVVFLYLMFNTLAIMAQRPAYSGVMFSVPYLTEIIGISGFALLFLAGWIVYSHIIRLFSVMSRVNAKVDWKLFTIPPAIFILLYMFYVNVQQFAVGAMDDALVLAIHVFSTVILFLFIWAFYVIIKIIIATNEAVAAKDEVKTLSVEVMEALAHTIDAKDEYTRGHSVRVAKYSRMLAEKLGLPAEDCENVYYMALLHDIGKIGVPNSIINSPVKLTDEEYEVIKTHPGVGYDILAEIKSRPDLAIGAHWHHERYDGKGYPDGKAGESIPLFARIIAVADGYDAMTSNRSYRKFMSQDAVRSEIEKNSGTQFDPVVAKCMLSIMDEDPDYTLHEA